MLVETCNRDMSSLLDKYVLLVTKDIFVKKLKRKAEKNWLRSPSTVNLQILRDSKQRYLKSCKKAKITYYQSQLELGKGVLGQLAERHLVDRLLADRTFSRHTSSLYIKNTCIVYVCCKGIWKGKYI